MKTTKLICVITFTLLFVPIISAQRKTTEKEKMKTTVWSLEKAKKWYSVQPWLNGCNYQPASAINQIEMWQAETFDAATIDKELGWAEELGFNTMRVFLSSVVWKNDASGLRKRIDQFLKISSKHNIRPMFVFFDDCWNEESCIGKQPEPKIGVHNSGWVQDPSVSLRKDTIKLYPELEKYVKDILYTFKDDKRILMWDLYNEPGNKDHGITTMPLLKNAFKWAREVNPSQPITTGIWYFEVPELNRFQIENSDVITYHNYENVREHNLMVNLLKLYDRPLLCTEYMARRNNSTFQAIMPMLKLNNVGAINWGFVSGKTNTIYAWDEPMPSGEEPKLWFHDIFRQNHTSFDAVEVNVIKTLNGKDLGVRLIRNSDFKGTLNGKEVMLYTLKNNSGMVAQITNFGGRVVSLWVPDKDGKYVDIVTGYKTFNDYQKSNEVYFGALIGRYGNRIANGKFTLNGKEYQLPVNNGVNQLHGGPKGFHNVVWDARQFKTPLNEDALELKYLSPDGDQGYPGNLEVKVIYTLTNKNELRIEYSASTDKPTVVNLTHHSFFNLHGFSDGIAKTVNTHIVKINGSFYTPTDNGLIPTGEIASVVNTPMDFTNSTTIGKRVNDPFDALVNGEGYDHNWILDKHGDKVTEASVVFEPETGIQMRVITDQPALQFYGGNFFKGKDTGKYGEVYTYRTSFAMETQHYPDSPNHKSFPTTVLNPEEIYYHICIYKFEIKP